MKKNSSRIPFVQSTRQLPWLTRSVTGLTPAYFTSVMATAVISVVLLLVKRIIISEVFWVLATVFYVVLIVANVLRMVLTPSSFARDFKDPGTMFGFFTFVASAGVLGSRFVLGGYVDIGFILGIIAFATWLFLSYWVSYCLLDSNEKPVAQIVSGTWLLITVGLQSLAIMATQLTAHFPQWRVPLLVFGFGVWGTGVVFYCIIITAVMARLFFSHVKPSETTPPYWINMGAIAITTLAGAHLALQSNTQLLKTTHDFIVGLTVLLWAFGTWWIPLLFIVGWWRHIRGRVPIRYDPSFWSMVFPIGMYTAATDALALIPGLSLLHSIVSYGLAVALIAWAATTVGYIVHTVKWLTNPSIGT